MFAPALAMRMVRVRTPPPALKLKLPPPPLVCLEMVRLATAWLTKLQLPPAPGVARVRPPLGQPPLELKPAAVNSLTVTVTGAVTVKTALVSPPVVAMVKVPIPALALKLKLPPPPLVCLETVTVATAWLVKLQLPPAPGVVKVTLPLPLQPPLELKPAVGNSLTVTLTGACTVKAVLVTPALAMLMVKVPIPPPALKLKLPPPPLVCLEMVRLATAWLTKLQLPPAPGVARVRPPLGQPPLELKPAAVNSLTVTVTGAVTVKTALVSPPVVAMVKVPIPALARSVEHKSH